MDFEEGEGVTSRSNSLFFLFYLILIKTYFENPPQNFCFSRMVTEGFDDERENVDEL